MNNEIYLDDHRPILNPPNDNLTIYGTNCTYSLPSKILEEFATGDRAILEPDLLRAIVREYLVMMTP